MTFPIVSFTAVYRRLQSPRNVPVEFPIDVDFTRIASAIYDKIKSQSVKTANKHMSEKAALRKKIEINYEIMKKDRQAKLEQLLLKYKNRKSELDNQQKQELLYIDNENLLKKSK